MTAGRDIFRGENSNPNVFAEEVFVRVAGHRSIGREVTALRAHHDFFAFETFRRHLPEGRADASLAALESVVDRSVDHIDAAFHRRNSRRGIAFIRLCVWLPEVCTNSQRGERQSLRFSKMARRSAAGKLLRVACRSFLGPSFVTGAPSGG